MNLGKVTFDPSDTRILHSLMKKDIIANSGKLLEKELERSRSLDQF